MDEKIYVVLALNEGRPTATLWRHKARAEEQHAGLVLHGIMTEIRVVERWINESEAMSEELS